MTHLHPKVHRALEEIDAALADGDSFDDPRARHELEAYLKRWQKSLDDDALYRRAVDLGCDPVWHDGMIGWAWHCTCADNEHGYDQQCSVITNASLDRVEAPCRS